MTTVSEESPPSVEKPSSPPISEIAEAIKYKTLEQATPWIDYAIEQALIYQKTIGEAADDATKTLRSRLSEIRSTSSAHFNQTIDSLQDVRSEIVVYEDMLFGKVKDGINVAASHPLITTGVATGLGFVLFKRPRRFLYYNTLRRFVSEEALLSKADAKVKELQQSINLLRAESEKLEKRVSSAEGELIRGRTKLRQAGKQIQGVISSTYKIARQAAGLKDILQELPSREASRFRSQVSNLASEAKRERNALTKEVTKISNYGISV
ncbi:RGS1-HXK1-interacting protein 1 [Mercurialis annua]|uniref:RGS1-HXK1-interacting protein 1 n=1 Tax=Mercurialis annua TaxID=3986 RepID=UPI002160FC2B|nr:RGS1-HXK1-interacting protein 1 [Mercurialis annua]